MASKMAPVGPMTAQDTTKTATIGREDPKTAQEASNTPKMASKMAKMVQESPTWPYYECIMMYIDVSNTAQDAP